MPTVSRAGPYRFLERDARHARRAKLWLDPVEVHDGGGFSALELARIASIIHKHQEILRSAWNGYFHD